MQTSKATSSVQSQTSETQVSPNTVDANTGMDTSSYFLVRPKTAENPTLSAQLHRPQSRSVQKSQQSQVTQESEDSNKSKQGIGNSIRSSVSFSTRLKNVREWNEKNDASDSSPCSYNHYNTRHPVDPPRLPRDGFEWVWFPDGYWAEREFRGSGGRPRKVTPARSIKQKWWNRQDSSATKRKSTGFSERTRSLENPPQYRGINIPRIKVGSVLVPETRYGSEVKTRKNSKISKSSNKSSPKGGIGLLGLQFLRQASTDSCGSTQDHDGDLGLYCRAKKQIKYRFSSNEKSSLEDAASDAAEGSAGIVSRTTILLEATSSYFDKIQKERKKLQPKAQQLSAATPQTIGSPPRYRRPHGLAPWHRKNSHESLLSVSSSVHRLLMGKTPVATPVIDPMYAGQEGQEYTAVDISSGDPHGLSFLPSEATRLNTPPLSPGMANVQARGFFFDLNAPVDDTDTNSETHSANTNNSIGSASTTGRNKDGTSPPREWWGKEKHVGTNKSTHSIPDRGSLRALSPAISAFELNTPEHLPSSPLCPKHPKHASGGTGICVYHGRRRSGRLKPLKRSETGSSSGAVGKRECL